MDLNNILNRDVSRKKQEVSTQYRMQIHKNDIISTEIAHLGKDF